MSWLRFDDKARTHPKLLKAGPVAGWVWFCGMGYSSEHRLDGFLPQEALVTFSVSKVEREAERLISVGLWERVEGGYRIHDYHDYNPSKRQLQARQARNTERVRAWRQTHGYAHGNGDVTLLQERSQRECNAVGTHPPDPDPEPVRTPLTPLKGGIAMRPAQLRKRAEDIRHRAFGRCPHEPRCATYEACIATIVDELRAQQVDAVEEATG